jgi:hypothetical protein
MKSVELHTSLDPHWLVTDSVSVGLVPVGQGTPDLYATVLVDDTPQLRISLYSYPDDAQAFHDSIIWGNFIAMGFGERVYIINLVSRQSYELNLGSYFGYMEKHGDELLIASAERVFCLNSDGKLQWQSPQLGIDGVVLHESTEHEIYGAGEWDPPGGWRNFKLSARSGMLL